MNSLIKSGILWSIGSRVGDGGGGGGKILPEHASPILHAPRDILLRPCFGYHVRWGVLAVSIFFKKPSRISYKPDFSGFAHLLSFKVIPWTLENEMRKEVMLWSKGNPSQLT